MGYRKHHAIIISGWDEKKINEAHIKAISIFGAQVTSICKTTVNHNFSFLIGPDGSSEYWNESDTGDIQRFEYIIYLQNHCYEDGSSSIKYVELSYADDKNNPQILNYS